MFNNKQKEILKRSKIKLKVLKEEKVFEIAERRVDEGVLSDIELVEFLEVANALYRGGEQIITDAEYDFTFIAELRIRNPAHPFLQAVEPEAVPGVCPRKSTVLSTVRSPPEFLNVMRQIKKPVLDSLTKQGGIEQLSCPSISLSALVTLL